MDNLHDPHPPLVDHTGVERSKGDADRADPKFSIPRKPDLGIFKHLDIYKYMLRTMFERFLTSKFNFFVARSASPSLSIIYSRSAYPPLWTVPPVWSTRGDVDRTNGGCEP